MHWEENGMKNNRAWFWVLAAALALALSAPRVMAEPDGGAGGKVGKDKAFAACKADLDKFCKDVKPGGGRLMNCLKEHEAGLSADCKAAREEKKEKFLENHPCAADMEKLCKDLKGKDRAVCMKEHEKDLSAACQAKRAERKAERKEERKEKREKKGRTGEGTPTDPGKK
jgi:hypothetical protein